MENILWWIGGAIALWLIFRKKKAAQPPSESYEDVVFRAARESAQRPPTVKVKNRIPPQLKQYVSRLCQIYHTNNHSFASEKTQEIGKEINAEGGYDMMVQVCDLVREQLGGGPARDLEYKWNGIGKWQG